MADQRIRVGDQLDLYRKGTLSYDMTLERMDKNTVKYEKQKLRLLHLMEELL
jgi:hypothetical protein